MTKKELRTGMRVTLRDGSVCVAVLDALGKGDNLLIDLHNYTWVSLVNYTDDMLEIDGVVCYDIMKVEEPNNAMTMFALDSGLKKLWKRKEEPISLTVRELEDIVGYKFKIVEDKK